MSIILSPIDSISNLALVHYIVGGLFAGAAYWYYAEIFHPFYLSNLSHLPKPQFPLKYFFSDLINNVIGEPDFYMKLFEDHGPVVLIGKNTVMVHDPVVRDWLGTYKFEKTPEHHVYEITSATIFSMTDKARHQQRRKLLAPAFSNKSLRRMEPTVREKGSLSLVNEIKRQLRDDGSRSKVIDSYHLFHCSILDVIGYLFFGMEFNCVENPEKGRYYLDQFSKTQMLIFLKYIFPILKPLQFPMYNLLKDTILANIKDRESGTRREDILQCLIDAEDPETEAKLTHNQILDECVTLLFSAEDTTANTMVWTLYEILKDPELYQILEDEVITAFPDINAPITMEVCKAKLKYLEATILESMRFHPAAGGLLPRVVPEGGVTVNGHYLPENTHVVIQIYSQHHHPSLWENPSKFNIYRWLGEDRDVLKSQLLAFSCGPRSCMGRDLAWAEIFLVLVHLIRHFHMELVEEKPLTPKMYFVYKPDEERMNIKFTLRD